MEFRISPANTSPAVDIMMGPATSWHNPVTPDRGDDSKWLR